MQMYRKDLPQRDDDDFRADPGVSPSIRPYNPDRLMSESIRREIDGGYFVVYTPAQKKLLKFRSKEKSKEFDYENSF